MSFVPIARYADAQRCYERALEFASPDLRPIVWWKKGEMFQKMGDFEAALSCYSCASELDSIEAEFHVCVGETMALGGDLRRGEESLRLSLKNDCKKSEYIHNALARVLTAQGNYPEAKRCYETALKINPEFVPALAGYADLENYRWLKENKQNSSFNVPYYELSKETSLTFLAHFEEKPSQDRIFWVYYGQALGSLWRYDEARVAFDRAREDKTLKTPIYYAWTCEGRMEKERGNYGVAQKCFENASATRPESYIPSFYIGSLLFRRGQLEWAEAVLRDTLKMKGDKDETLFVLGGVLLAQERYLEAVECYRDAIKIDPDYEIAKIRLLDLELALRWMEKHNA